MGQIVVGSGLKQPRLERVVHQACGCVVALPAIESDAPLPTRLLRRLTDRPRYLARCGGKPNHRTLKQLLGG